jgi:hypothetical protein
VNLPLLTQISRKLLSCRILMEPVTPNSCFTRLLLCAPAADYSGDEVLTPPPPSPPSISLSRASGIRAPTFNGSSVFIGAHIDLLSCYYRKALSLTVARASFMLDALRLDKEHHHHTIAIISRFCQTSLMRSVSGHVVPVWLVRARP